MNDAFLSRALWAAVLAGAAATANAAPTDCSTLSGYYENKGVGNDGRAVAMSHLLPGQGAARVLYTLEEVRGPDGKVRRALTAKDLTVLLSYARSGTLLAFFEKGGQSLGQASLDFSAGERWTCKGTRLERHSLITSGLGDKVHIDHRTEVIEKDASGNLIWMSVETKADKPDKPYRRESRFAAASPPPRTRGVSGSR